MAAVTLERVRIKGLVCAVPKSSVSNLDCAPEKRSERERLVRNIGILHRRICYPWLYFSDLAQTAAERVLDAVGWKKEEIDELIVFIQSPEYKIPAIIFNI